MIGQIKMPSKAQVEQNISICNIRITAAIRCFPGDPVIAELEMQKKLNIQWLEYLSR